MGPAACLLGLGTARPGHGRTQGEVCTAIADAMGLSGPQRLRWERIWRSSAIEARYACAPIERIIRCTTAERMRLFDEHATPLAVEAARHALRVASVLPEQITDLVVVTCTGFSAPGVPRKLISALPLDPRVRTTQIGFMGCFGGVCGLRTAAAHALLEPQAKVLLVCVELCSLHLRPDPDAQNLVASALFADGAAAAVLAAPHGSGAHANMRSDASSPRGCGVPAPGPGSEGCDSVNAGGPAASAWNLPPIVVRPGGSCTIPGTLEAMSWTITDAGFAMALSREVPAALSRALPELLPRGAAVILHPGGPAIIDAVESAIDAEAAVAIDRAREVLREGGNMSSASVLFVLDRWRRTGGTGPAAMVAFGPGLTIDFVELAPASDGAAAYRDGS